MAAIKTLELVGRQVVHKNGVALGEVIALEDGFYYFEFSRSRAGLIPAYILREVADILDAENAEFEKQLAEYHKNEGVEL
jgi:hypothetical protein